MKMKKRISLLMVLCLMVGLLCIPAEAATDTTSQDDRWNIILVVDGSGSLYSGKNPSDPSGLRYEALDLLIDLLHENGNYVGAVVFNANNTKDDSDEAMRKGIALNTGLMEINGAADKKALKDAIKNAPFSGHNKGDTDIGTALLVAQQELAAANNGLNSAIYLFSDGASALDYKNTREKSQQNMNTAIENIRDQGIKLCGVFLNCNDSDSTEVRDIVAQSIGTSGYNLSDLYMEITDPSDISIDSFLSFLGYNIPGDEAITSSTTKTFRIPGVGVEEANIRIRTAGGESLPEGMVVTITRPDGTTLTSAETAAVCSSGRTYRMYKLVNPMSGTWSVYVGLPEGNTVGVYYNPILSVYVDAGLETSAPTQDLHVNGDVTLTAYLEHRGVRLTDAASYREYECVLELTDVNTGEKTQFQVTPDSSNNYSLTLNLDEYGVFDAQASFVCDSIVVTSDVVIWDLKNHTPTCNATASFSALYGMFQEDIRTIDLSDSRYGVSDIEDDIQNLKFSIQSGTCNMQDIHFVNNSPVLELDVSTCGSGEVVVSITDTQGASTTMTINVTTRSVTAICIAIIAAVCVAILLLIFFIIRTYYSTRTNGSCAITISIPQENNGDIKNVCCKGLTPPGGSQSVRKTNLYALLSRDIDNYGTNSKLACEDAGISYQKFCEVVKSLESNLKQVKVRCVLFKDKQTKRPSTDRMRLVYKPNKQKNTIHSGEYAEVRIQAFRVRFSYSAVNESGGGDDPWGFDNNDSFDSDDGYRYSGNKKGGPLDDESFPEDTWGSPSGSSKNAYGSDDFGSQPDYFGGSQDDSSFDHSDPWGSSAEDDSDDDF